MNKNTKNLIEIDFYNFIKILYKGIWIILFFAILGVLIGYIYEKNYQEAGVKYRLQIPIYELDSTDQISINNYSNNILKLYKLDYERLIVRFDSPTYNLDSNDDFIFVLDQLIKSNVSNILENSNDFNFEKNIINSKDLITLAYQITQRNDFSYLVHQKHNQNIKYSIEDKNKIESFLLKEIPDLSGGMSEKQGSAMYTIEVLFMEKMEDENVQLFAQTLIEQINSEMHEQLINRYELAKTSYFSEINNIQKSINYIITTVESEYKLALISKIKSIEFQRDIAIEFNYKEPVPNAEVQSERDSYKRGYLYLDKELSILKNRLESDLTTSVSEIRFYTNALRTIKQNITLERVTNELKHLGLFDKSLKIFEVSYRKDKPLIPNYNFTKIHPKTLYAIPFSALLGIFIGIVIALNNFFITKRKNNNA